MKLLLISALATFIAQVQPAAAILIITGQETGSNVEFSYSGSLNVTGLTPAITSTSFGIRPSTALLVFFSGDINSNDTFANALSGPTSFGSGSTFVGATSQTGGPLLILGNNGALTVPNNYISGTTITGSLTFNGQTFATLGITPGTYNYNLTNGLDTIQLNIGTTPIPFEFSPLLGFALIGGLVTAKKLTKNVSAKPAQK
ncbi:MAG: hypothetical protein SFT94_11080 [Pseudanabaenaceae cyanobacterium bins.68]|nr:hypothetical protein [Pseudanabaenaceae cyanobacterium bins.68]